MTLSMVLRIVQIEEPEGAPTLMITVFESEISIILFSIYQISE